MCVGLELSGTAWAAMDQPGLRGAARAERISPGRGSITGEQGSCGAFSCSEEQPCGVGLVERSTAGRSGKRGLMRRERGRQGRAGRAEERAEGTGEHLCGEGAHVQLSATCLSSRDGGGGQVCKVLGKLSDAERKSRVLCVDSDLEGSTGLKVGAVCRLSLQLPPCPPRQRPQLD